MGLEPPRLSSRSELFLGTEAVRNSGTHRGEHGVLCLGFPNILSLVRLADV